MTHALLIQIPKYLADPHSPLLYGFLHSHMGWFLFTEKHVPTQWEYIPDLSRYKELVWLNEYNWVPGLVYGTLMMLIGGPATFFWGFLVRYAPRDNYLWRQRFVIIILLQSYFGMARNIYHQLVVPRLWVCSIQDRRH
jgi:hypothetical protein